MFNEGAPEFLVDQGLYYPIAANQGYYCTGFESSGEWDDHHKFLAVDGVDVQYPGVQTENMPYVYYNYTPSYEYAQSPYNPYNPYIPGAMIGVDGQFASNQQFYAAVPQYQNGVPSSYYPVIVQSRPDIFANGSLDNIQDGVIPVGGRPATQGYKHNLSSSSAPFTMIPQKPTPGYSSSKAAEGKSATAGPSKHPVTNVRGAFGSLQNTGNVSKGRIQSSHNQFKPSLQYGSGLPGSAPDAYGYSVVDKLHSKFHHDRSVTNVNESPAVLVEQNKGPRTGKSKTQLAVKADTTSVVHCDSLENIASHCNKTDFPVDYVNAKFFVIKSYSEDDVHKSIKYNVWSSTPNGNKKLDHAYKDAQIIAAGKPSGCPIFLFFSVNASGQYCGVAEMIGPVDFQKDMDFWQQDKWSGSFPVKWHIIKDVPNTNFRQITLENNENKPVTNSRDTQEILFKPGLEMLRIMKNHTMKTSLLDDFMYYEDRQKMMQDGKARVLVKSYGTALFVPTLEPPRKISHPLEVSASKGDEATDNINLNQHERSTPYVADQGSPNSEIKEIYKSSSNDTNASTSKDEAADDLTSVIKIGSLTINPKRSGASKLLDVSAVVNPKPVDAVTLVSSIPVKPNKLNTVSTTGTSESPGLFTVGTIPLDPRAMKLQK